MTNDLEIASVVDALRQVLPTNQGFIPLHEPQFGGNEWQYVKECLDTGWVSTAGKYVERFEQELTNYTQVKFAVAVINGTAALHICLKLIEVEPNDEVLIPALTFIATANAVIYCGAVPHFVDSEKKTLGIDPQKLNEYLHEIAEVREGHCWNKKTGRRIQAIVPMHTFGHPVDMDPLIALSQQFKIAVVEDAAESLGSYYKKRHTGHWGAVSALSFNGNKVVTTGGGGAILTNNADMAKRAKHLTTTAKTPHPWEYIHDQVGYNYRLPNLNAALGCAQLEQLPGFIKEKRALAETYRQAFESIKGIHFFTEMESVRSNYWLNVLLLDDASADQCDALLDLANRNGIMMRPAWTLMHQLPMFEQFPRMDLRVAENIAKRLVNIPSSVSISSNN